MDVGRARGEPVRYRINHYTRVYVSERFYFQRGQTVSVQLVQDGETQGLYVVHGVVLVRERLVLRAEAQVHEPADLVVEHLSRAERRRAGAHGAGVGLRVDRGRPGALALARGELVAGGVPLVRAAAEVAEVEERALYLDDPAEDRDGHDKRVAAALRAVAVPVGHHAHLLKEGPKGSSVIHPSP